MHSRIAITFLFKQRNHNPHSTVSHVQPLHPQRLLWWRGQLHPSQIHRVYDPGLLGDMTLKIHQSHCGTTVTSKSSRTSRQVLHHWCHRQLHLESEVSESPDWPHSQDADGVGSLAHLKSKFNFSLAAREVLFQVSNVRYAKVKLFYWLQRPFILLQQSGINNVERYRESSVSCCQSKQTGLNKIMVEHFSYTALNQSPDWYHRK